jgi:hypothetical protein
MRALLLIPTGAALAVVGWLGTVLGAAGCDENLHPDTTRTDVCNGTGLASSDRTGRAVLYASAPLMLFAGVLALLPVARRRVLATAVASPR